jgi:phospholipid/cholesterol/gamma-HCH transport system substrate-binding protein
MVSRSLNAAQAAVLGIAVLCGIGLAGVGLAAIASRGWFGSGSFNVRAGFPTIRGVEIGTPVRIQGIVAGEVVGVDLPDNPGDAVMIRMRLRGEYRRLVRDDARVQIISEGMLGNKVVEIKPGSPQANPVADNAVLASVPTVEIGDALDEVKSALQGFSKGEGPLGEEVLDTVKQTKKAATSFQQTMSSAQKVTDAAQTLPWFRNYVKDQQSLLIRSNQECNYRAFSDTDLFPEGGTTLTAQGEQRLQQTIPWLSGLLAHKGAELVVVAYQDPKSHQSSLAQAITERQSEAVCAYLRDEKGVNKVGWLWSREVKSLGLGTERPVVAVREELPPSGVVLFVFVPRK